MEHIEGVTHRGDYSLIALEDVCSVCKTRRKIFQSFRNVLGSDRRAVNKKGNIYNTISSNSPKAKQARLE